jgi:hypothetical protein
MRRFKIQDSRFGESEWKVIIQTIIGFILLTTRRVATRK